MYRIGKPCATSKSYFITPEEEIEVDLEELAKELESMGWNPKKVTKVISVFEKNGLRISAFPTGKLIVREVDEEVVRRIAEEVWKAVEKVARRKRSRLPCPSRSSLFAP